MGLIEYPNDKDFFPLPPSFPIDNLKDMPVYVWGGMNDQIVNVAWSYATREWFRSVGANVEADIVDMTHMWPNALPENESNPK